MRGALRCGLVALVAACGGDGSQTVDATASDAPAADVADAGPPHYPRDDSLRLNHLQAVGTHNSYHVLIDGRAQSDEYRYEHAPLDAQLDLGVRQFELDVHLSKSDGGLDVYHVPIVDEGTTCRKFKACLGVIKAWSDINQGHHPVFVFIEPKDDLAQIQARVPGSLPDLDEALLDGKTPLIDAEIRDVFGPDRFFEPDDLKGAAGSLKAALDGDGWPTLGEVRSQVVFVMLDDKGGPHHADYTSGEAHLDGRAMFITAPLDAPYAAVTKQDNPTHNADAIATALAARLIVRTRADGCCEEADANDTARRDLAMASGAHFVSTDFVTPHPDTGYVVAVPGGTPSRCNPVTAPAACTPADIEALPR